MDYFLRESSNNSFYGMFNLFLSGNLSILMKKTIMEEFSEIKTATDKLQDMMEMGQDEYAKTHSNCCDARMLNGICLTCKEPTVSQKDSDY